ncbi:MAG: hypothetical protein K6T75_11205 [Acetobacteraceae bacterium]|nr:hypothetical protein [Acetobacteraceae bacterium]
MNRHLGVDRVVRVATCGSLQPRLSMGSLIVCTAAERGEGTSRCYVDEGFPAVADFGLTASCIAALTRRGVSFHVGPVWTTDGRFVEDDARIGRYSRLGVLGVDMETAAYYSASATAWRHPSGLCCMLQASCWSPWPAAGHSGAHRLSAQRGERQWDRCSCWGESDRRRSATSAESFSLPAAGPPASPC